ncbi:MAG: dienelactone hydrolase family protein [Gemmatimonadetes bacterium]|nr:dienelactone hydrolase family protein [Gemmatimonadota bacterium]
MRRGAVPTLLIAALGIALGAAGAVALNAGRRAAESPSRQVTTHGEWVKIASPSGDSLRAYVAYPERKDKAPAVIVIHEILGLTEWEPTVADRLAGAGYVAIVPDLLSPRFGVTPASPDSGRKLTALLEPEAVNRDLDAAYAYLNTLPAVRKDQIGTIGFCWGGARSFRYATHNPALKAAVICYGSAPDSSLMPNIRARLLGVYGEEDARINAALPDVERQLAAARARFSYTIYPGTGHGFLKPGRKGSDTPAVDSAWADVLGFYTEALR